MKFVFRLSAAISIFLCASFGVLHAQQDRIARRIDNSRTVRLKGAVHLGVTARNDLGPVDPSMPIDYATLHLKPSIAQQAALERLLSEQQDISSPNYHHWLTPEEYGERFGLSRNDLARVVSWLQYQGLTVHDTARGRHWITFSGTAGQVGVAFHTQIHRYRIAGETHIANSSDIAIPDALADVVAAIRGLDDFRMRPNYGKGIDFGAAGPNFTNTAGAHYMAPDDLATIYDINRLYNSKIDGTDQKIAVIGRTAVALSDIRAFRTRFNLPPNDPQMMLFGPDPGTVSADLSESDLDLEWSGAVARNAQQIFVYATGIRTAAQYAVDQNIAPVMTYSYGGCEAETTPDFRAVAQQAAAQGITWLVSTGDVGAAGCERQQEYQQASRGFGVQFPSSVPEITAVGGTELDDASGNYWAAQNSANGASALSYIPEKAWNDSFLWNGLASTTGGASIFFSKPAWQTGPGVPSDNTRHVPDIALAASWDHVGYITYTGGGSGAYGGTSVATPAFAGVVVLLNQYLTASSKSQSRLGNINPTLYRLAQTTSDVFHDITNGDNIVPCIQGTQDCTNGSFGFTAGSGYDLTTGLGSIDAYNLVMEWTKVGTPTATTISATPATAAFSGGNIQLTATVNASGGSGTPTGNVSFIFNDAPLGSATLTSGGGTSTASLNVDALTFPLGANTITAFYEGDATFNSSSGSTSLTINAPSSGSAVSPSISPNPVYQLPPDASGYTWHFRITLKEQAGVPTTLTGFTMFGQTYAASDWFNSVNIPAHGSIFTNPVFRNLKAPLNGVFTFTGKDADGTTWTRQITVPFILRTVLNPSMILSSTPATVLQNPAADSSCQWPQQLTLEERAGFPTQLTRFTIGGKDSTSSLQQLFGATRLAPFGMLHGVLCWPAGTTPGNENFAITGSTDDGFTPTATVTAPLAGPSSNPSTPSVSPASLTMNADASGNATASVNLNFSVGSPAWTVALSPANRATSWLTVAPLKGSGSAQLSLTASGAGLSNGVYNAMLIVEAADGIPQYINVPVAFAVGASSSMSIAGVVNSASFKQAAAPGMILSVFGSGLAPSGPPAVAGSVPFPLIMEGVTATINGVGVPLWYVSPTQLNVQVPYETGAGPAVLGVNNNGQVASFIFDVTPAAPGIYAGNGTLVPFGTGKRGDTLLLFLTGAGDVTPFIYTGKAPGFGTAIKNLPQPRLPVTVTIGGEQAGLLFVGIPPGLVGVTQINFTIPQTAPLGTQNVIVNAGGVDSPAATLTITQ